MHEPTVASWFSGVGGLDMGLERAGFRIVSHSEIEPHACAILARHWPDVPNLGDITTLGHDDEPAGQGARGDAGAGPGWDLGIPEGGGRGEQPGPDGPDWTRADVWAGGPPCQGFSVAGQRRGLRDHRSSLATTWLELVGRYRPGALLLENVPGILSSARGVDWYALLRELGDLGYWWAYRVLDAQWLGVPQRRSRVFLIALDAGRHPDPDGPGQVLAVSARCGRDHAAEREAWASSAGRTGRGAGIVEQAVNAKWSKQSSGPAGDEHHHLVVDRAPHHAGRGGAPDGLAGRPHDRAYSITPESGQGADLVARPIDVAPAISATDGERSTDRGVRIVQFVKAQRAHHAEDCERWEDGVVNPSLNSGGQAARTATLVAATLNSGGNDGGFCTEPGEHIVSGTVSTEDDPLLPLGQDSARYKVIGNGVVTPVAEWIGRRLYAYLEGTLA